MGEIAEKSFRKGLFFSRIALASDHAGFRLKEAVKKMLVEKCFEAKDFGAFREEPADDYPDYILPACEHVAQSRGEAVAVVFGGSGIGECIAANKVKGVRAAIAYSSETAKLCREHNNANVLCLGGRTMKQKEALEYAEAFLNTPFSGEERHARRLNKIAEYEKKK